MNYCHFGTNHKRTRKPNNQSADRTLISKTKIKIKCLHRNHPKKKKKTETQTSKSKTKDPFRIKTNRQLPFLFHLVSTEEKFYITNRELSLLKYLIIRTMIPKQ